MIEQGKSKPSAAQINLETLNSRARTFSHEATHLDYFMNVPKKSPYVGDTTFSYKFGGKSNKAEDYGPYNAKSLRNQVTRGRVGFYTQRSGARFAPSTPAF